MIMGGHVPLSGLIPLREPLAALGDGIVAATVCAVGYAPSRVQHPGSETEHLQKRRRVYCASELFRVASALVACKATLKSGSAEQRQPATKPINYFEGDWDILSNLFCVHILQSAKVDWSLSLPV